MNILTLEVGANRLSQKVGDELPLLIV